MFGIVVGVGEEEEEEVWEEGICFIHNGAKTNNPGITPHSSVLGARGQGGQVRDQCAASLRSLQRPSISLKAL